MTTIFSIYSIPCLDRRHGGAYGGSPGLFHFVALRPYNDNIPFMMDLHLVCAIVGAQCNEVE